MLIDNPEEDSDGEVDAPNFKANINDPRFSSVISNPKYALDPTHKDFHKMKNSEYIKKKNRVK